LMVMSVSMGAEARLWRLPMVSTPAITEGYALVGSFGIGATLYDRMEGSIRVAEQHSDFFIRNAVAILAEERLALAVKRPESFVEVEFDGAPE
jgi:HK97 family phage major capsid protein